MLQLTTPRLILRHFVETDWPALWQIIGDAETVAYMHFGTMDETACRDWFTGSIANSQLAAPDAYNWAIVRQLDQRLIGWIGIGSAEHPRYAGERDFGYVLHKQCWNHGYMTEAITAVIAYEFTALKTPVISATHDINNPASGIVMQKVGMRCMTQHPDTDNRGNATTEMCYVIHNPQIEIINP